MIQSLRYTVCVRTCDGAFFPVSYFGADSRAETLEQVCQSLCPNADVALPCFSENRFTRRNIASRLAHGSGASDTTEAVGSDRVRDSRPTLRSLTDGKSVAGRHNRHFD
jgi:hypothetical protein